MEQNYNTFLEEAFFSLLGNQEEQLLSRLCELSGIEDSFSYRSLTRARALAFQLVDSKGHLIRPDLEPFKAFYPHGLHDHLIFQHQQRFLKRWKEDSIFFNSFKKFSLPLCHRGAERLTRETLLLPSTTPLTDAHIRQAVISACLTLLRQNIGSCFATAPAIIIHEKQLDRFLGDLYEMLTTGRLRRVIGGAESSVPMSLSAGVGNLRKKLSHIRADYSPGLMAALNLQGSWEEKLQKLQRKLTLFFERGKELSVEDFIHSQVSPGQEVDAISTFKGFTENALLKSWEFTLASLSEVKMEFSRWNLYTGLGFQPQEKGGVGEKIYAELETKLEEVNEKVVKFSHEYNLSLDQSRAAEGLLRGATSEAEARRLRAEYQARYYHMRSCLELYEKAQSLGEILSQFPSFLIKQYNQKFPEYFQEIYDVEMGEFSQDTTYDDSPAGFRLVYKHGRQDASLWTPIHTSEEFIRSIVDFFKLTEARIAEECATAEEKKLVTELTTSILQHVRSEEFMSSTLKRMKKHGRTPWSYLSGGTMDTLIKTYYRLEETPAHESRFALDALDLLTFILDTLKGMPRVTSSLLASSPTHAFALLPDLSLFKEGWEDRGFTYTWIRDRILLPGKKLYERLLLPEEQSALMQRCSLSLSSEVPLSVREFCALLRAHGVQDSAAFLYRSLPLTPRAECQAALQKLLEQEVAPLEGLPAYLTSEELQTLAKAYLVRKGNLSEDIHGLIAARAQSYGLAPCPLVFADTNWINSYFAFLVSPESSELELWRVDRTGSRGAPMGQAWFHPSSEKHPWAIYTKPHEAGL